MYYFPRVEACHPLSPLQEMKNFSFSASMEIHNTMKNDTTKNDTTASMEIHDPMKNDAMNNAIIKGHDQESLFRNQARESTLQSQPINHSPRLHRLSHKAQPPTRPPQRVESRLGSKTSMVAAMVAVAVALGVVIIDPWWPKSSRIEYRK